MSVRSSLLFLKDYVSLKRSVVHTPRSYCSSTLLGGLKIKDCVILKKKMVHIPCCNYCSSGILNMAKSHDAWTSPTEAAPIPGTAAEFGTSGVEASGMNASTVSAGQKCTYCPNMSWPILLKGLIGGV